MDSSTVTGSFYKASEWIMKIVYLNILWICFTLMGLVLFGLFPATVSLFTVCRQLIIGDPDLHIFRTFKKVFKQEFFKSNLLGLLVMVVSFIFYIDYLFFAQGESLLMKILLFPFLTLSIAVLLSIMFLFPTFVHYKAKLSTIIKNAFLIPLINPLMALLMILSTIVIYIAMMSIPGLIPFFGVSVLAWIYMFFAIKSFEKIEKDKQINIKKQ